MKGAESIILRYNLINKGEIVGVACSGGRDSMCLLHFLNNIKENMGFELIVINIDHSLRENSKRDSSFVVNYCVKNNIKVLTYKLNVKKFCEEKKLTIEQGAREARYDLFRSLIKNKVVNKIALGHHLQDQSETILLNILRGSGLSGASGMDYIKNKVFIRPLLKTSRSEIQAYIERNNVPYVDDETNLINEYSRNYIRNLIMPLLRNKWPNADSNIAKFGDICKQDDSYIYSLIENSSIIVGEGVVKILTSNFIHPSPLINRIIFKALKAIKSAQNVEKKHIEIIKQMALEADNGTKINLPNQLTVIKEYNYITITNRNFKPTQFIWPMKKGTLDIRDFGILEIGITRKFNIENHNHIIDYNKLPKTAVWRFRQDGDVFEKFGGGTKNLNDFFIDRKVPARLRNFVPVLADGKEIFVVAGQEISNKVKIDITTKTAWTINVVQF